MSCTKTQQSDTQKGKIQFNYLALGDSYTIGEGVSQAASFPYQLTVKHQANNKVTSVPKIIARTGWTTDELQTAISKENINKSFDLVTLLIGVNNQYRGYSPGQYRVEFTSLLQQAITFANGNKEKVYVLSIPDWGVTPFGKNSGRSITTIATEIDAFNAINKDVTLALGAIYIDITTSSRKAAEDRSLIANDGLHPSEKMYADWVKLITDSLQSQTR
ncbi:SGNH/GDSL hydrolase family protein [Niabella hibiscisoli]|uniref:SGNH/GDSL hydrolase family protein n=1 Tax=Niabella hibiscisoli TaxID=1825928 RepID=UPI001F0F9380|nr:SGNH/GDSL hydrolase family protein [Niabella hibiscisoli]MCH5718852.1 SGNH/GDSL hydrolase family protein [Niabella hibiscisoli]